MRLLQVYLTVMLLASFSLAYAGEDSKTTKPEAKKASAQGTATAPVPATTDPDYVIGALDVLAISVWKEPEVSGTVPVRPDGKISVPLLDDVQAAGFTPMQLAALLSERLNQYMTEPRVTVTVTAINSKRIYLMGEIGHVGPLNMLPNMTVLQALASGGGFSEFANLKKIYILRIEKGKQIMIPFNYKQVIKGEAPEQNILLKPGDTIVVP